MLIARTLISAIATTAITASCTTESPNTDLPTCFGKCDGIGGNGTTFATYNNNASILRGYIPLFDRTMTKCVEPDQARSSSSAIAVGSPAETFEVAYVTTREELAKELGIDLGLRVKIPTIAADVGLNLLDKFSRNSNAVSFLVKVQQEYVVMNGYELNLTTNAADRLAHSTEEFYRSCGSNYINGIRFGSNLFVLITYETHNEDTAQDLRVNLGVEGAAGTIPVEGDLKTRMTQAAGRNDVNVTVRMVAQGFELDGYDVDSTLVTDFVGEGVTDSTFGNIDKLRRLMVDSIRADRCQDAGDSRCDGVGYFRNTLRKARPTGLEMGFYDSLPNSVSATGTAFREIQNRLLDVELWVRDLAELQERMTDLFISEVEPFLNASESEKALYQLLPPVEPEKNPGYTYVPRQTLTDLNRTANYWMDQFYPVRGPQAGWEMSKVVDAVSRCWTEAAVDLFGGCAPDQAKREELWNSVLTKLEGYRDRGRILPLRISMGKAPQFVWNARSYCESRSSDYIQYRLPTRSEVSILAPVVAYGPMNWGNTSPHEIWYDDHDPASQCPSWWWAPDPSYVKHPEKGTPGRIKCNGAFHQTHVICVASPGPTPQAWWP